MVVKSYYKRILIVTLFLIHNVAAANICDSIGTTRINGKLFVKYLVSPGETIYGISTRNKIGVSDLMEINPELESGLKVGQVINIPYIAGAVKEELPDNFVAKEPITANTNNDTGEKRKEAQSDNVIHTVQPGETLYSLARKYNVAVNDLMKWNNLELKVGQEVVVSKVGSKNVAGDKTQSTSKPPTDVASTKSNVVSKDREVKAPGIPSNTLENTSVNTKYEIDSARQQLLIIPFDPYLYFSDADDEIAARSKIPRTKIRQLFRRRMNALLDHPAYENIHLLGGKSQDSLTDLNKIYSSVTYNYQDVLLSPHNVVKEDLQTKNSPVNTAKAWLTKQKEKIIPEESSSKAITAKDNGKYFGVLIKNPSLFNYFNEKYDVDYYVFVNQFEVKTNYEHCLDRAAQNYERTFTTHYSIFDAQGKQISGNRFNTHYNSNSNNIEQILVDNVQKIADHILKDLPVPKK